MDIHLNNLTLSYNQKPVVQGITGTFATHDLTAIVGPNGAGKSTLLKSLMGLHKPDEGTCSGCAHCTAYLPQLSSIDRSFPINVIDTVLLGHWKKLGPFKRVTSECRQQALEALAQVGLQGLEKRPIEQLSAGQFQRVLFARIQLQNAPVILLDEPFTGIDLKTVRDLMQLVQRWKTEQRTVIAVLHDLDQVQELFPNTLLLSQTCIGWGKTSEVLTPSNLQKTWDSLVPWKN